MHQKSESCQNKFLEIVLFISSFFVSYFFIDCSSGHLERFSWNLPKCFYEKSEYFLFKIRKKGLRKKGCFRLVFSMKCSSGYIECSFDNTAKSSLKKTDEILLWIRQIMKICKNIQNQSFCSKIGTHKCFSFRHVESSLYNCAGSSFTKTLRVCAKCQKNY